MYDKDEFNSTITIYYKNALIISLDKLLQG